MADVTFTTVNFISNIQGVVTITPETYQFELNTVIGNTFTIVANDGYLVKNYSLNNVLYTENQIKELLLTESNSTEYIQQIGEYKHTILVIMENLNPNEVKHLNKIGLKRLFDNIMLKINSQKKVITILVNQWDDGTYTLLDNRITETSNQTINMLSYDSYTDEQRQTISAMGLYANGQGLGWLKLKSTLNVPTIDIQLEVIFRGEK